ncbi:MAG: GTPase Era [Selenomonadaceae bacterium]|nr:GTPase Era [Selenomonadaceae bacterium]
MEFKSGFVAVIGRPNVGKSTLVNSLIGQKVAIMSDKPQTTRSKILCILTRDDSQMIFLDTPGIHKPLKKLGERMLQSALGTLQEVDLIFFVVDANEKFGGGENFIIERLKETSKPVILVLNKIDLIDRKKLLPIIASYDQKYKFAAIIPISAKEKSNLESLIDESLKYLPDGVKYFPDDMVTDQPERLITAELIREKILELTRDEIPHSVAVDIDEIKERENGTQFIRATIYVERDSQKGILIGKNGAMLKEIGSLARQEIGILFDANIFLDLWVKVRKDWRNSDSSLKQFGFKES